MWKCGGNASRYSHEAYGSGFCLFQWDFQGPPIMGPPYGKRDPYYSHTTPITIPKDMGIVWEAYHKGVPLLGVPENPIDCCFPLFW